MLHRVNYSLHRCFRIFSIELSKLDAVCLFAAGDLLLCGRLVTYQKNAEFSIVNIDF